MKPAIRRRIVTEKGYFVSTITDAGIEDNRVWCIGTHQNYADADCKESRYSELAMICAELLWRRRFMRR